MIALGLERTVEGRMRAVAADSWMQRGPWIVAAGCWQRGCRSEVVLIAVRSHCSVGLKMQRNRHLLAVIARLCLRLGLKSQRDYLREVCLVRRRATCSDEKF